jgi:hypothetical protein
MEMEAPEMQYMNGMLRHSSLSIPDLPTTPQLRHKTPSLLLRFTFEEIFLL